MAVIASPIKWPGGKAYLAKQILELAPPHTHYVEPYFGSGAVLFAKDPEGVSEVVNDLDQDLTTFWRVLQNPDTWAEFVRVVEAVPFSEAEFDRALVDKTFGDEVDRAVNFFVLCRQSMMGARKTFAPLSRTRTRRGMNEQVSAWLTAVDGLPEVHRRLRRVVVLCRDALDVIRGQDGPDTFFYVDCPYLHETRESTDLYRHEMSPVQHEELLRVLSGVKGKFLLSGYRSELYDRYAAANGWWRRDFQLPNAMGTGEHKRLMTECLWGNYDLTPPPCSNPGGGCA